jgi:membrane protease YdiL (CAAX protease family)
MNEDPAPPQSTARTEPPHWKFWPTILWGLLVAVVVSVVQGLIVFWEQLAAGNTSDEAILAAAEDGTLLSLAVYGTTIVGCALVAGIVKLKKDAVLRDYLALYEVPPGTVLRWLAYLAIVIVLSDGLTTLLGKPIVPEVMVQWYASTQPAWILWGALIVAAPLFEEVFFRGFLFKGFQRSYLGTIGAVVLTAALWALVHLQYDAYGMATVFVLGLLLGAARARTGSLVVPLLMHSMANVVATIETAIAVRG